MKPRPGSRTPRVVRAVDRDGVRPRSDEVVTEEPLEIRLAWAGQRRTVAITMRTPGADFELAAGFLYAEGVISERSDVARIDYCSDPDVKADQRYNVVTVELSVDADPDLDPLERHFYTTSACGVCGKATLDGLRIAGHPPLGSGPVFDARSVMALPERLREAQRVFERTGGLHAAALFSADGSLVEVREDVGRHNAVDKLTGWALLDGRLPLRDHALLVSGRASFEIMQKALRAGIGFVCAVSAPSSLACDVADDFGMTLVGFLREGRFNVYAGADRIER